MGITVETKITSQVTNFIKQILSFLACGGSCTVKLRHWPRVLRRIVGPMTEQVMGSEGSWTMRSFIICTLHQILLG
jgi:hypothetical protein